MSTHDASWIKQLAGALKDFSYQRERQRAVYFDIKLKKRWEAREASENMFNEAKIQTIDTIKLIGEAIHNPEGYLNNTCGTLAHMHSIGNLYHMGNF